MLCGLAGLIPAGPVSVLVDGSGEQPAALAARLAATLTASGRPCVRLTGMDDADTGAGAVARAGIRRGGVVIDVGCGTGRALPALRQAVGSHGAVIAADLTPAMLATARPQATAARAALVLADARTLPFADASADALFAAGLINHLPDPEAGLGELARVTRAGGLLVLFHPSGRAALAARHGRTLTPDEPLSGGPLTRLTLATGWQLTAYDDAADHFFALASRTA